MASGAMRPGGMHAPEPGGLHMQPAGGVDVNQRYTRRLLSGYPDFDIEPGDRSGARVAQTRNVANLRTGRASAVSSYAWTLPTRPGGSTAVVTGGSTASASFTPDLAGTYVLQVVVTFNDSTVVTKTVQYVSA